MTRAALLVIVSAALLSAAHVEQIAGGGDAQPGVLPLQLRLVEPFGVDYDRDGNWYIIEFAGNRLPARYKTRDFEPEPEAAVA